VLGMGMHGRERKDKAHEVAERLFEIFDDPIRLAAIRAFVVAVFHESDRRAARSFDVISSANRRDKLAPSETSFFLDVIVLFGERPFGQGRKPR
jgi:hypothetical protein